MKILANSGYLPKVCWLRKTGSYVKIRTEKTSLDKRTILGKNLKEPPVCQENVVLEKTSSIILNKRWKNTIYIFTRTTKSNIIELLMLLPAGL
jgi:hypothetical protein